MYQLGLKQSKKSSNEVKNDRDMYFSQGKIWSSFLVMLISLVPVVGYAHECKILLCFLNIKRTLYMIFQKLCPVQTWSRVYETI